ncbi:hypothetical protein ACFE04_008312 [Oxalis oulophora]
MWKQPNCTEAKFVSYDASTPVPYLTPPTRELDKSFGNDFGQKYAPNNGYTYDSHVNFQSTFQNGSGDFFMANDKSTFHLLPFSTETEPDLLNVKLKDFLEDPVQITKVSIKKKTLQNFTFFNYTPYLLEQDAPVQI